MFAAGGQARVPLLVGWNTEESGFRGVLGGAKPTRENFEAAVKRIHGEQADEVLRAYPAAADADVAQAATDLVGDRLIGFSTCRWADLHGKTVYRDLYARLRPPMRPEMGDAVPGPAGGVTRGAAKKADRPAPLRGAVQSAEIEYALGNLDTNKVHAWNPDDGKVSQEMQGCFANFVNHGDPSVDGVRLPAPVFGRVLLALDGHQGPVGDDPLPVQRNCFLPGGEPRGRGPGREFLELGREGLTTRWSTPWPSGSGGWIEAGNTPGGQRRPPRARRPAPGAPRGAGERLWRAAGGHHVFVLDTTQRGDLCSSRSARRARPHECPGAAVAEAECPDSHPPGDDRSPVRRQLV